MAARIFSPHPGAALSLDQGRVLAELCRARPAHDGVLHRLGRGPGAGRLRGRSHWRSAGHARSPVFLRGGHTHPVHRTQLRHADGGQRVRRPGQRALSSGGLLHPQCAHRTRAPRQGLCPAWCGRQPRLGIGPRVSGGHHRAEFMAHCHRLCRTAGGSYPPHDLAAPRTARWSARRGIRHRACPASRCNDPGRRAFCAGLSEAASGLDELRVLSHLGTGLRWHPDLRP